MATRGGTIRTLRSQGGEADDRLRVFVAEGSASDLFWLEMVFKSSRLPYIIEVVPDALAAREHLETSEADLILLDSVECLDQISIANSARVFVLSKGESASAQVIEKPFTQEKLLQCLCAAELDVWVERLSAKPALAMAG